MKTIYTTLLSFLCLLSANLAVLAQATAFTYQGRLVDGGVPANGLYDFQFALRDAASSGNAVGSPLTVAPVSVTNGIFTVTLDFGRGRLSRCRSLARDWCAH